MPCRSGVGCKERSASVVVALDAVVVMVSRRTDSVSEVCVSFLVDGDVGEEGRSYFAMFVVFVRLFANIEKISLSEQ